MGAAKTGAAGGTTQGRTAQFVVSGFASFVSRTYFSGPALTQEAKRYPILLCRSRASTLSSLLFNAAISKTILSAQVSLSGLGG